jgi:CRISPR-associated protein Csm2
MVDTRGNQNWGYDHPQPQAPQSIKIEGFYGTDGKTVKSDLFDTTAEKIADTFLIKNSRIAVSKTQLRRLFDEVKRFEQIIDVSPDQWAAQLPYIRMIKSKVSYAVARAIKANPSEIGVYKNLSDFITQGINLIKEPGDYHVFVSLFEAAYGFYWEKNPKKD